MIGNIKVAQQKSLIFSLCVNTPRERAGCDRKFIIKKNHTNALIPANPGEEWLAKKLYSLDRILLITMPTPAHPERRKTALVNIFRCSCGMMFCIKL